MPESKPLPKLNVYQLALLEWLCELEEGRRLFAHVSGIRPGPTALCEYQIDRDEEGHDKLVLWHDKRGIAARFGRSSFATDAFVSLGLVDSYPSSYKREDQEGYTNFLSRFSNTRGSDNNSYFVPNKKAFVYWREIGEPALRAVRQARLDHSERVRRMIVLSGKGTVSVPVDIPWVVVPPKLRSFTCAYGTATVVRETATRIYVESVTRLCGDSLCNVSNPVFSDGPNFYVSPESILIDHATTETVEARVAADGDYITEVTRVLRDASSGLTSIVRGFEEKLKTAASVRSIGESRFNNDSDESITASPPRT